MDTLLPSETHGLLPLLSQVPKSFVTEKSNAKVYTIVLFPTKMLLEQLLPQKHNCK